ncbi:glycosyltransferase family 2 protein [Empedobacter tilapiae]|uniref:Glycosyltransferase family 2 protein n=1 Tax=Empedobacter tilapiae TaxID=2491114 RepID=A0A4Z1C497_9FLAO|nr:glycosyltransferase family 2 protein [Empedobacter tilapiae]TGN27171.1 glycosyltransferase family 2 protein [Empedobacter tilapiae]
MFKRIKNHLTFLYYQYLIRTNSLIKKQRKDSLSIPILIINFNQLFYLKQLVNFLLKRGFENIIIIDNKSTYPPLLEYYKQIENQVTVEYMQKNAGHMVFFENKELQKKYGQGYYVITDADIVPNDNLPKDFMAIMLSYLDKYFKTITKVGFALKIDDIPDHFPLKEKVLKWERKFWNHEIEKNIYKVDLDTTFALYKPNYPCFFDNISFYNGIRISNLFIAKHGGWYKDFNNLTHEEKFYQKTANDSSSWNINKTGGLVGDKY